MHLLTNSFQRNHHFTKKKNSGIKYNIYSNAHDGKDARSFGTFIFIEDSAFIVQVYPINPLHSHFILSF